MNAVRRCLPPWSRATLAIVAAALLLAIAMGQRSALGLFVSPLNTATGLGIAAISLALAIGQLASGIAQPLAGMLADRVGAARVVMFGSLLVAGSTVLVPLVGTTVQLSMLMAMVATGGALAGSNGVLLGVVHRWIPEPRRGLASGIVGAGGSAGQMLVAPATQAMISSAGWVNALFALAAFSLLAIPAARSLRTPGSAAGDRPRAVASRPAPVPLRIALRSPVYWSITATFFACGFHVSFLTAHVPGVVERCGFPAGLGGAWLAILGLFNMMGSILAGIALRHFAMTRSLASIYLARAVGIALFALLPKTEEAFIAFAVWMGLSYMATLPPTVGLIARACAGERLGTLLGITMFIHQVGSFLGVWLGGIAVETTGDYAVAWYVDLVLTLVAAAIALRLRVPTAASAVAEVAPRGNRWIGALERLTAVEALRAFGSRNGREPPMVSVPYAARCR